MYNYNKLGDLILDTVTSLLIVMVCLIELFIRFLNSYLFIRLTFTVLFKQQIDSHKTKKT